MKKLTQYILESLRGNGWLETAKTKEEPFVSKARSGFVLSLVGTILSIVMFIGFVACIGLMAEQ